MIFGSGIDIVDIKKTKEAIERWGDRFNSKIFTPEELKYCSQKKKSPFFHLAGKFAAKEAFLKALGREERDGISWKEIEILNSPKGRPSYQLRGKAKTFVTERRLKPFLTISHTKDYAIAHCILEK